MNWKGRGRNHSNFYKAIFNSAFEKGKGSTKHVAMAEGIHVLVFVVDRNKTAFPWVLYYSSFSFGPSLPTIQVIQDNFKTKI